MATIQASSFCRLPLICSSVLTGKAKSQQLSEWLSTQGEDCCYVFICKVFRVINTVTFESWMRWEHLQMGNFHNLVKRTGTASQTVPVFYLVDA